MKDLRLDLHHTVFLQFSGRSLADYLAQGYKVLDVRTEGEFESNTVKGAVNIPLGKLNNLTHLLDKYVTCVGMG